MYLRQSYYYGGFVMSLHIALLLLFICVIAAVLKPVVNGVKCNIVV